MKRVERSLPESITLVSSTSGKEFSLSTQLAQESSRVLSDLLEDEDTGEYRIPMPREVTDQGIVLLVRFLTSGRQMQLMLALRQDGISFIYLTHYLDIYFPHTESYLRSILYMNFEKFDGFTPEEQGNLYYDDTIRIFSPRYTLDEYSLVKSLIISLVFPAETNHTLMRIATVSITLYAYVFEYWQSQIPAFIVSDDPCQRVLAYILHTSVYGPDEYIKTRREALKIFPEIGIKKRYFWRKCILESAASNCLSLDGWEFQDVVTDTTLGLQALSNMHAWSYGLNPIRLPGYVACYYKDVGRKYSCLIEEAKAKNDLNFLYKIYPAYRFRIYVDKLLRI